MNTTHEAAAVTGVGETGDIRAASPSTSLALQLQASLAAVRDAGIQPGDIDGVIPMSNGLH